MKFHIAVDVDDELIKDCASLAGVSEDEFIDSIEKILSEAGNSLNRVLKEFMDIFTNAPEDTDLEELCRSYLLKCFQIGFDIGEKKR